MTADSELSCLMETVYLLRSPRNAERLFAALREAQAGGGEVLSIADLRQEAEAEFLSEKRTAQPPPR